MDNSHTLPEDAKDNKLGLFNLEDIHYMEAIGIAEAKTYMFELGKDVKIDMFLLKDLHRKAFGRIYHWAGKIRTTITNIGVKPFEIQQRLKIFLDNLDYRLQFINPENIDEVVELLAEVHHMIVYIHPFVNGNGRIARLFTNLISLKLSFPPFEIYVRDVNKSRRSYIDAIRKSDKGDYTDLRKLVKDALLYSIKQYEDMTLISL